MSYQIAYTTHFHSLDNTLWNIDIYINDYAARPLEICLEGDEPCVIEWQETAKMDVVQSSTCTLRVSNESDRQMVQLMNHPDAAVLVSRDGKWYWWGHLDDAIYEEPYSFKKAYVTELIFSDFGILNRIPFTLTGKQSVWDIVRDCLDSIGYGNGATINLYISLLEPKTQQPITLDMLYINADRFESDGESWDKMTSKREVLEEILRPLGLRIMQKNAQIYIFDIEYLRNPDNWCWNYIVWKGTDAYLKGSETFGLFEVAFEPDAIETLADDGLNYDSGEWDDTEKYLAKSYDLETETDSDIGFYIETKNSLSGVKVHKSSNARFFRTRSVFTDSSYIGVAWRIICKKILWYIIHNGHSTPCMTDFELLWNYPSCHNQLVANVLWIETGYLPLTPDREKYQLRVNLDVLLSFRQNPFDNPPEEWVETQDYHETEDIWENHAGIRTYMIPVKLEVLADDGTVAYHYENASTFEYSGAPQVFQSTDVVCPFGINKGRWVAGAGAYGQMFLAYYHDAEDDPVIEEGWVTNRIASSSDTAINGTLYRVREDGEYVSLPPVAGRLRLTVGDGIFVTSYSLYNAYVLLFSDLAFKLKWQAYRNPKITIVRANRRNDGINTDTIYEREKPRPLDDHLSDTVKAGCWRDGIAPSARGLFFNADGIVWEKFKKDGRNRTLEKHRLQSLEDQTFYTQPVLSGTAEFDGQFCAKREESTSGIFLVTALRQDLQQDTEKVTMARIANMGGFVYEFSWSNPFCTEEEGPYIYEWSSLVCIKEPGPYKFSWGKGVCVKQYIYTLEWEEMQTYD